MLLSYRAPELTAILDNERCQSCGSLIELDLNTVSLLRGDIICLKCGHKVGHWRPMSTEVYLIIKGDEQ